MTTTEIPSPAAAERGAAAPAGAAAPRATFATALALVAGPAFVVAGMATTPWESEQTTVAYQASLLAHPDQAQVAALLLFLGYALSGLAFLAVLQRAGAAPKGLRIPAAVFAFCGATMLPGLVVIDFYDLALIQNLPAAEAARIGDEAHDFLAYSLMQAPGVAGLLLGNILVIATAWRARLVGGWAPIVVLVGWVASFAIFSMVTIVGGALLTLVAFGAVAAGLRSERGAGAAAAQRTANVTQVS